MKKIYSIIFLMLFIVGCASDKGNNGKMGSDEAELRNEKIKIITFVPHEVLDAVVDATKKSLIEKYDIPKKNIEVFNPNGNLDEIRTYVRALNRANTDLIVSVSTPTSQAVLSSRHPSIPLVFSFVSDANALSLHNYENVTGISNVLNYAEGFKLLKELIPNIISVCVIYNPTEPNSNYSFKQIKKNAELQAPPIKVQSRQFSNPEEISVIASTVSMVDAFYVGGDNVLVKNIKLLLNVAKQKNVPVFASDEGSVKEGAIAAYSIDYKKFGEKTGDLVYSVIKNNHSCNGIEMVMYDEGERVLNKKAINAYGIKINDLHKYKILK